MLTGCVCLFRDQRCATPVSARAVQKHSIQQTNPIKCVCSGCDVPEPKQWWRLWCRSAAAGGARAWLDWFVRGPRTARQNWLHEHIYCKRTRQPAAQLFSMWKRCNDFLLLLMTHACAYGKILVCIRQKMKEHEIEDFRLYSYSGLIKSFVKTGQIDCFFTLFAMYIMLFSFPNINNLCNILLSLELFCLQLLMNQYQMSASALACMQLCFEEVKIPFNLCKTVTSLWVTRAKSSINHHMQKWFPLHLQ